jgi:hypothetical protein
MNQCCLTVLLDDGRELRVATTTSRGITTIRCGRRDRPREREAPNELRGYRRMRSPLNVALALALSGMRYR